MAIYALAGNPNAGKTSLFNLLTGTRQHVGNWSGVTVEKKMGYLKNNDSIQVVDLPGIYSISPFSVEERVASRFLVNEEFDGIINIVDASNLERNLYFTLQLLEYGKPMVMSLNMIDVAKSYGIDIDVKKMEEKLGIPIVLTLARKGQGLKELSETLNGTISKPKTKLYYGKEIELAISKIENLLINLRELDKFEIRWLALQILENNDVIEELILDNDEELYDSLLKIKEELNSKLSVSIIESIRETRYKWIGNFIEEIMKVNHKLNKTWTDKIDSVVTNQLFGIPIFLFFMYLTFQITFTWVGAPLQEILDGWFSGPISDIALKILTFFGASEWLKQLVVDGIIAGVGGILVFVPQIFVLFLTISFLEDSGYMARAAFIMDKLMSKIGLSGKSFIPMIIGFGCNVPGIMSARTIEQPKARLITILLTPFMSCSAKLAVYALFVSIFFEQYKSLIVLSLYLLGIIMAILVGLIFKRYLLDEDESLFVIELPPYRVPMLKNIFLNTWDKGKSFIKKAGTIIFAAAVIVWFLSNFSFNGMVDNMNESLLANLGKLIAPIFEPLGFGTWEVGVALIGGFMAKEIVVSTLSIVYGAGESMASLATIIQMEFTAVSAYAFMVFVLLYTPCVATLGIMKKETGSWKWPLFSILYTFVIAWVMAFLIYQIGSLFF